MTNRKKQIASTTRFTALLVSIMLLLAACGGNNSEVTTGGDQGNEAENTSQIQVVTSFYPLYYMATQIGGEHVQVTNMIAAGIEPHDWTPKSKDLLTATNADLLLYHGVGLETWIDDFKKGIDANSGVILKEVSTGINLIDPTEEATEDHAHEDEHAHEEEDHTHADDHAHEEEDHTHADEHAHEEEDHAHADDHAHEEEATQEEEHSHSHDHSHSTDPHTWVSPKSALILAKNIKDSLVEVDPDHAADYEANYTELANSLTELDKQYTEQLAAVPLKTIVVSHQSFGYVARDYQLEQISIMGLSPSAEPRAQDILKIANTVKENGVKYIFFEELVSDNLAKMLASEAKVDTMLLNSLEGLTTTQEKAGEDYISLMEMNLQNLVQALQ